MIRRHNKDYYDIDIKIKAGIKEEDFSNHVKITFGRINVMNYLRERGKRYDPITNHLFWRKLISIINRISRVIKKKKVKS